MSLLSRYTTANFASFLDEIYADRFISSSLYKSNSRFVSVNNEKGILEVELAGYSKDEIEVYTKEDCLYVKAKKKDGESSRSYYRAWSLAKDEVIGQVKYVNGLLTVEISKVIPEQQKRKDYSIE
jgi:molecular chaperone IbpA